MLTCAIMFTCGLGLGIALGRAIEHGRHHETNMNAWRAHVLASVIKHPIADSHGDIEPIKSFE